MVDIQKYKESGIQWIGQIPNNWEIKKIKHGSYVKGRIGWKGLRSDEFLQEGFAYLITGTDFQNGRINWGLCYHIDQERYEEDPYIQLKEDDLLITKDGTIGKIALVKELDGPACLNSGIFLVRPTNGLYETEFLYWILSSNVFNEFINYRKTGSTISHLYQNVFVEFEFPVPPQKSRTAIANFLDIKTQQIDDLIERKKRLIDLLKEERTAVINQAVTKGLDPTVPMKDSGIEWLGEIPEHWEVKRLKYLVEINKHKLSEDTDQEFEFKYVDIGNVSFGKINNVPSPMAFKDAPSRARRVIHKGDTIVSTVRTYLKAITYIDESLDNQVASTGFAVLTPLGSILDKYLFYLSTSDVFVEKVCSISVGVSYPATNASDIGNIEVWLPTMQEQIEIVEYISNEHDKINNLIKINNTQIDFLKEYKTSLINETVTGKIDVRNKQYY